MRLNFRVAAVGLALAGLAACSAPNPGGAATLPERAVASAAASAVSTADVAVALSRSAAAPKHLTYLRVGVDADVLPTGLNPDGTVRVPPLDKAAEVDYIDWSTQIKAGRPTVFLSHRNGRRADGSVLPGGFGRLPQAQVGDRITVTTMAGTAERYTVSSVREVLKDQFPTSVYDPKPGAPTILLITCSGNLVSHDYRSNTLVRAELDGGKP